MSIIDEHLRANTAYADSFLLGDLPARPARGLAVLACMDARLSVEQVLGLRPGDAHIIRNAGGIATEDALRSLIISQALLGTRDVMIINHTECGLLGVEDADLKAQLAQETGVMAETPEAFHTFHSLEENVREQVAKVRAHPWIKKETTVRGFIYDVRSGRLLEVT